MAGAMNASPLIADCFPPFTESAHSSPTGHLIFVSGIGIYGMEKEVLSGSLIKAKKPERKEILTLRFLICCALCSMFLFVSWFASPEHIGYGPIFWVLSFTLLFKLLKMIQEWYHYWSISVPAMPDLKTRWAVDILTTACPGEPKEMIIRTLCAIMFAGSWV
jgi:hypothetical protein